MIRPSRLGLLVGGTALAGYATLQWLGRAAGSTRAERRVELPGDDLVDRPRIRTDHAITIDAPPEDVWPWLVQMGWHRAGWYTARWVDVLLFPANEPSAERIHPEWQDLAVGDRVPDGPPETECWFVVRELHPQRHLVLHSRSHLPPEFRDRFGAAIDWSWVFRLEPVAPDRTRFHFRSRLRVAPGWLAAGYRLVLVPADWIMGRQMLQGVKRRAEGRPSVDGPEARRRLLATMGAVALMAVTPAIRPFHRRWGATDAEVHGAIRGDELLSDAQFVATRAITIDAPAEDVWPWLPQVGVDRAGFYSYDLIDHRGVPSRDDVMEQWQHPAVGDIAAPMTEPATPMTSFVVAEVEAPHVLVWSKPDSTWAWQLTPLEGARTRLVTRLKVRYSRRPTSVLSAVLMEFADFAMMRRMLLGIRDRAQRRARQAQLP